MQLRFGDDANAAEAHQTHTHSHTPKYYRIVDTN